MDSSLLRSRCSSLLQLLESTHYAQLLPSESVRAAAKHRNFDAPIQIIKQQNESEYNPQERSMIIDWISAVMMHSPQTMKNPKDPQSLPPLQTSPPPETPAATDSHQLPDHALTTHVLRLFRPLLSSLLARVWSADSIHFASASSFLHAAEVLTHVATICPHVMPALITWFRRSPYSLFAATHATTAPSTAAQLSVSFIALRLLHSDASVFRTMWDWSPFITLVQSKSNIIRWLAASSIALLLQMNEADKNAFIRQSLLTQSEGTPTPAQIFDQYCTSITLEQSLVFVDGKEHDAIHMTQPTSSTMVDDEQKTSATASSSTHDQQLSSLMVSLGGVLLPRRQQVPSSAPAKPASTAASSSPSASSFSSSSNLPQLIQVKSTNDNLRAIALAVCEQRPILLEGPSGSGKTMLVEEVARQTGYLDDLVRLHLDDQMDSKTLLGTYTCTDIPGEFRWVAGALTQAVLDGRWVLIEDIDRCPFEILSAIISLLERRELFLSGRGELIHAAAGFQLFATKTVTSATANIVTESTPLLHALFSRVYIQPLTYEELTVILGHALEAEHTPKKLVQQILATYMSFVNLVGVPADAVSTVPSLSNFAALAASSRKYSTRDLLKWVSRIRTVLNSSGFNAQGNNEHLTQVMLEEIFLGAIEIFVSPIPPPVRILTAQVATSQTVVQPPLPNPRLQVIEHLAVLWKIDPDRVRYFTEAYKPRLDVNEKSITLGRVSLNRSTASKKLLQTTNASLQSFAFTKYSLSMMEHICMCIYLAEPVLLVSDTGVGKTTTIQLLANLMGKKLHVQNLNQQSDSADLIGGFKPVEVSKLIIPLMNSFGVLFPKTFSRNQNTDFLNKMRKKFEEKNWNSLLKMMKQSVESAEKKLNKAAEGLPVGKAGKTAKTDAASSATTGNVSNPAALMEQWATFSTQLTHFSHQLSQLSSSFVFHFNEGALVTALKNGDWILLDEINLASSETLERLSGILEGATGSLALTERGDSDTMVRHPEFRLFGAMNPGSDAGKKPLPPAIRTRFTEMFLEEMTDPDDLHVVIKQYLEPNKAQANQAINSAAVANTAPLLNEDTVVPYEGLVKFYLAARAMSASGLIQEGSNSSPASSLVKPHYSLRTLCRGLQYAMDAMRLYGFNFERALWEGMMVSFCTLLTPDSSRKLQEVMKEKFNFPPSKLALDTPPKKPTTPGITYELVGESFYIPCGPEPRHDALTAKFILTASVRARLRQLSRAMLTGKYPILLQGPTSGGKTSLVEYLALKTGHKFVRINNHEHTDLQEYLGSYVTDPQTGKLVFQEGVLVDAVRKGHWIVLDELNLAPSEVLEALNRLLDDNRELFLPETQETIKPHPHFLLFATQNPSGGIYGGRKILSKAFRNRFVTLHIDDLPENEIEEILHLRCKLPPSYCKSMIGTMKTLQTRREKNNVFAGKRSFMTPRDLFRWGERGPASYQQLAEDGFMLLGERLRTDDAKAIVKEVLEKQCKAKIDEVRLYSAASVSDLITELRTKIHPDLPKIDATALLDPTSSVNANSKEAAQIGKIAWTYNMRRLFIQVGRCLLFEEPVLLVGETGIGKTTVCQLFSLVLDQLLRVINCHQHTESSDFLGGLRPVRGKDKTAAELKSSIKEFVQLYQQAQPLSSSPSSAAVSSAKKDDESMEDTTDEKVESSDVPTSSGFVFTLPTLSEIAQCTLSTFDTAALPELVALYTELSTPLSSMEKKFNIASKKYTDAVEAQVERERELRAQKKNKHKKQKVEQEDVDMDDAANQLPPEPTNPVPAALWKSITELNARIAALNTRFQSLFEWVDGALVQSLRQGELLLIDEISLADDAVLERLNSVLEPSRTLFLAEKGGKEPDVIKAASAFRVFATMNPGGDFGKKELSPALRNRFTEIWVPPFSDKADLLRIITERMQFKELHIYADSMLEFVQWFNRNSKGAEPAPNADGSASSTPKAAGPTGSKRFLSLRDILGWVSFMNQCLKLHAASSSMSGCQAYLHGSALTVLDGLGIGSTDSDAQVHQLKTLCIDRLLEVLPPSDRTLFDANPEQSALIKHSLLSPSSKGDTIVSTGNQFGIAPFLMNKGTVVPAGKVHYALSAATTQTNLLRILRAMTLPKAILLEGPPGVGKTSILTTLAAASGHRIVRINLSEQTDMMDLLGMDLPVPGGSGGEFQWCDGIFLQALKAGDWVLLDELNLASQSVLEGLNAVLDHRAQVFIPELDQVFDCPSTFRIFACQNPMSQGGGRKGLPASFLNRFTKVYLNSLTTDDLFFISSSLNPHIPREVMHSMIHFNSRIHHETMVTRKIGRKGFPWEFNLRDVFKWCELMKREQEKMPVVQSKKSLTSSDDSTFPAPNPGKYVDLIYLQRMRTKDDRAKIIKLYQEIFGELAEERKEDDSLAAELVIDDYPTFHVTDSYVQVGRSFLPRRRDISAASYSSHTFSQPLLVLKQLLRPLSHLASCMQLNFPTILLGEASTGKTSLVRLLAQLTHNKLHEILMTSGIDSSELLGCFEQVDLTRHKKAVLNKVGELVQLVLGKLVLLEAQKAGSQPSSTAMEDVNVSESGKATSGKGNKRNRQGDISPSPSSSLSQLSISSANSQVTEMLHTWSLLDYSYLHTQHSTASSLLAKADESESAQTLSTAAFSNEQFTLLQALLNSIEKNILPALAIAFDFTAPHAIHPSLLLQQAQHIQNLSHASQGKVIGNFEWIDGSLIHALEQGDWILLDNVNFCNPTVLDRLNPLLEIDGVLLVNECGLVDGKARIIKPHPNFRMILAMDPRYGEISRAMRNRCLEICLVQPIGPQPPVVNNAATAVVPAANSSKLTPTAVSPLTHDLLSIVNSLGIFGLSIPEFMVSIHSNLVRIATSGSQFSHANASAASLKSISVRNLKHWSILCAQQLQTGATHSTEIVVKQAGLFSALLLTFKHSYNLSLNATRGVDTFSDQLYALFDGEYRKLVLGQKAPSSMLTPTLWPSMSHALTNRVEAVGRDVTVQGSVLKYLAQLALGQSVSVRDVHLLHLFRQVATERSIDAGHSLSYIPDALWQFVFGLAAHPPATVKKDELSAAKQTVILEPSNNALAPVELTAHDSQLLLPSSSLSSSFALSAHPLHPHPTSVELFHLAIVAFLEYSNIADYKDRIEWMNRELLSGLLFEQQSTSDGSSTSKHSSASTDGTVARLRTEVQLAQRTLSTFYTHPLAVQYSTALSNVIERCGFDSQVMHSALNPNFDPAFLELLRINASKAVQVEINQVLAQWEVIRLLIDSVYHSLHEAHIYAGVNLLLSNPSQLSLMELSYACFTNLIHSQRVSSLLSGLSSELILQIYPFWTALESFEKNLLDHGFQLSARAVDKDALKLAAHFQSALQEFIHVKKYFWKTIYATKNLLGSSTMSKTNNVDSMMSEIHIRWKGLSKKIRTLVSLVPGLETAVKTTASAHVPIAASSSSTSNSGLSGSYVHFHPFFLRLQSTLQGTTHASSSLVGVKNTLWKKGGHPLLPREKALQEIEIRLQDIEQQINYNPRAAIENSMLESSGTKQSVNKKGTQPFFIVDANFKQVLVEAYVNLKFLYLQSVDDKVGTETEEDLALKQQQHKELVSTLASLPDVLQSKLRSSIDADKQQLDSMRFHVQIVGEGEESLEDLGFDTETATNPAVKAEDAMDVDGGEDEQARVSANFLSVNADASATTSSRFSEQSSHKKSFIMPLLLPIFDLAYLEYSRIVVAHVQYIGFVANEIKRLLATANAAAAVALKKKKTKRTAVKGANVDTTLLHTLTSSLYSALKSLLSFLPSLLLFYANKTSAISGILDAHAVKLVEMICGSLRDELEAALSNEANLSSALSEEKVQSLFSHIPSLIQEVQYHYANFQQSFLHSNATLLSAHSNAPLDSSFLLTPVKSLLVLDLISQSLNISLIHRHAKRIQLQLLGDYLARDLIRAPRVSKKDQSNAALALSSAAASSAVASKHSNVHAAILELVSLTTSLHAVIVCFESYFQQTQDYSRVLNFLNSIVQQLLKPSGAATASFPSALPADVKQSLLKVQDPRLNSLLNSLVFPLINLILAHMANLQTGSLSSSDGVFHLGHATLLLSLLKFYLLLPVSPVDSNQKYFVLLRDETYFSTATRMQFEWNQWQESLLTGRAYSKQLLQLQQAYQVYQSSIATFHKKVTYRRFDEEHTKPFHQLFQEFHRFANTFLDLPKLRAQFIEPMVKSAAATADENSEAHEVNERLLEELESFQTNSTEFISRIQSSFSEYPDFIVPLLTSLHAVKHGLSLMQFGWSERQQQQQRLQTAQRLTGTAADKHQVVYQTVRALVAFPFGTISSDAEGTSTPRARVLIESDTHSPGLIPPLHHLTHQPILASIDSLCRAAVEIIKEQSIARKAAAQDAQDAGLQAQTEAIAAAAFKGRSSAFYSIRLHLLQIVLQRILLFSKVSGRLTPDLLKILDALFRTFIDIYKANEEKRALREQEEKELFKYKEQKEEVLTEEEKDKMELQALFPDYSAEFTDIVGSDALPNMDDAVEESQRREAAFKAQQEAAKQKQQDSDDEYGILSLSAEHLQTIYNTFTAIFSIQKASVVTSAVTASVTFTEQESQSYVNSYAASYEAASTLLQALSMQGLLSNSALISSPQRFEQELKTGHLFVITKLLHQLNFAAANSRENEVNAIMESFLAEDNLDEKAIAVDMNSDVNRIEVQTSELEEGIKMDGKTGTKQGDLISTSAAAAKNASSKVDWTKFPDIYHEPNMEEVRKLEKPLTLLMLRLRQLLNQYANHPILVQLIQLSHRVLNFPSSTPLMKILTGLELLLKKAEEWEKYAARFVSIKKELVELGILVARWRKMELYTWPKALASREQVFHQSALRGWFHLYGLIHTDDQGVQRFSPEVTAAADATASSAASANSAPVSQELIERNFMQKLYEALDEFLSNSNLGELKTRMNILLGFYQQMNLEIVEGFGLGSAQTSTSGNIQHATAGLRMNLPLRIRIQHLLLNLYQFYEQFIPYVEDVIKAKKAPLEKSLREQVKLAKWDLSNYWSLKESSEKSHRKLQKYSKDYEEILQLTFKSLISKEEERDAREGDDSVNFGRSGAEVAEARRELDRVEKKLQKEKAKAKKKAEKLKAAAAAVGGNFQQDEDMDDAAGEEDFGLPSLALSLTIVLPEVSLYLSDRAVCDAWFQQLDTVNTTAAIAEDDTMMDTTSTTAAVSAAPTVSSYQSRLPTMYHKMQVLCNKGILSESYSSARQDHLLEIEEFSIHLISRVQKLTLPETKFSYKKKAFVDIMKNLKEMGLSYHSSVLKKADVPAIDVNQSTTAAFQAQAASIPSLFLQSPLTSVFLKSSSQLPLSKSETYEFLRSLSKKCEAYLYRVWSGIKKLRYRATSFNKDLNAAEVQKAKGMLEHLFFITCEQRDKVSQMAVEYHTTRKWMEWIKELDVENQTVAAAETVPAITSTTASNSSFPSWSTRFWSHKHLLDSLFSSVKYLQLLYSRMRDTMLTQDSGSLKPQLEDGVAKIQSVLQTLSAAKIETDAKIARLFPNLQLAHTTGTSSSDVSEFTASTTTAAESCLELNDAPNAQFLLSNIDKILSIVTVQNETPSVDAADEEGSIIELPFMATTSTFNELIVSLIRSKYEIKQQAAAAASTQLVVPATTSVASTSVSSLSSAFTSTYHSLISALLLSVQTSFKHAKSLAEAAAQREKVAKGEAEANTNEATAKFLLDEANVAEAGLDALYLQVVNQKLHELTTVLNQFKPLRSQAPVVFDSFRVALHNLVPLVDQVLLLSERALGSALNLHRSLLKLAHVLLAPLNKILARGFCRKPDEPENDENQSGETEEKEGTGMGEGEGQKDVSNQITDEEQLLGTKDEMEKEKNQEKPPKDENPDTDQGVEMDNDFEGDMHDVPSEDENEEGDDDKEKEELDREMGDLGEKQDVVDEKMWDHSDDDEDQTPEEKEKKRQEEKYERDAPVHGAPEEDEIAAKEDQQNEKDDNQPPEKDPAQEHAKEKEPKTAEDDQQPPQAEEDEDGEEEEPVGPINEDNEDKYEDKQGPDAMNNLPDDLALDDEEKEDKMDEGVDEGEDEANEDGDEKMDEEGEGLDEDKQKQLEQEDGTEQDDGKGEDVGEEEDRADKVDEENPEADENQDPDNPDAPNAVEAPPAPEVDESEDPNKEDDTQEPDVEHPDKHADPDQKDTNQGAHRVAGGEQGHAGAEDEEKQEEKEDKKEAPPANDSEDRSDPNVNQDDQTVDQANSNDAAQGTESDWQPDAARSHPTQPDANQPKKKKQRKEKQAPNPFKSLGDANKQWLERLKILDDSKEENPEETQLEEASDNDAEDGEGDDTMDGTFENASKEEKADAQMLGPVEQKLDADEMPKIRPQADEDEKMDEEDNKDKFQQEDQPPMTEEEKAQQDAANKQDKSRKRGGSQKLNPAQMDEDEEEDEDEDMSSVEEEEEDSALFDPFALADEEEEEPVESRIGAMEDIAQSKDVNPASDPNDPNHQAYLQQLRDDLDAAMQNWESSASSDPHQRAQDLWNKFADLTSELSASLTESLRMILEPMVATKLKGDYKTGKRINIKKIIPYIASSFRKDKIWLKRTKPNKRHYQVLITIDDSQSMKNNKAGRLALEAMTVLCKALSALEVGELAVASFGDQLKLLHPFTKPFTDDSGAFTVSNFQFQQQFTRWPDLLERTVSILDEARTIGGASSASAEHHQLVFIISDARVQQDRETVARWTREALSKNQLLVLIIVESGELKDSILSTKTVSYPNGKMKIADYLDDFPFPYYILLRDIQSLPEIVADALRQWFELVRSTS